MHPLIIIITTLLDKTGDRLVRDRGFGWGDSGTAERKSRGPPYALVCGPDLHLPYASFSSGPHCCWRYSYICRDNIEFRIGLPEANPKRWVGDVNV